MSNHEKCLNNSVRHGHLSGVVRLVKRTILEPIIRWRKRQATIAALSSLDDRILQDIGIARGEIARVADEMIRRGTGADCVQPAIDQDSRSAEPLGEMRRAA